MPRYVTQRRNRRQRMFFQEGGCAVCRGLLPEQCLNSGLCEEELREFGKHRRTGWPLGTPAFVAHLEHWV